MNEKLPIRRKGYYRALKKLKPWALNIHAKKDKDPLGYLFALTYTQTMNNLVFIENHLLSMIPKYQEHTRSFYLQPIVLGLEYGFKFKKDK